jgi:hypothetical protein
MPKPGLWPHFRPQQPRNQALSAFRGPKSPLGAVFEMNILGSQEVDWEPADIDAAGCYSLRITRKWAHNGELSEWNKLEASCFGLQVRVPREDGAMDVGQTAMRQENLAR